MFGHGFEISDYFDSGFDALLNFSFKHHDLRDFTTLDSVYSAYSNLLNENPTIGFVNFLSSHDEGMFDLSDPLISTALMLAPGSAQIYYGEETSRPGHTRSMMNWNSLDTNRLSHFQTLARFKRDHPALGIGRHQVIASEDYYAFQRVVGMQDDDDKVIVVLGAEGRVRLNVSKLFPDDAVLQESITGKIAIVSFGMVQFTAGDDGILLISER